MKKVMFMLAMLVVLSSTVMAQKDTITYKNGWTFGRSAENAMGVYLGLDTTGVRKVVLSISEDSVRFNKSVYYVESCQDRGKDFPIKLKDCYLFIINDKNDESLYMYLEKVNNRNAVNKYHFVLKRDEYDEMPMITEIITKSADPNNATIDPVTKREDREKRWWFNKMFATK